MNDAGVIGYLDQIQVFVPVSHLGAGQKQRGDARTWVTKEVSLINCQSIDNREECRQYKIALL